MEIVLKSGPEVIILLGKRELMYVFSAIFMCNKQYFFLIKKKKKKTTLIDTVKDPKRPTARNLHFFWGNFLDQLGWN